MRTVKVDTIIEAVASLVQEANYFLNQDMITALKNGLNKEKSAIGQEILQQLLENANIAAQEEMPLCQDTGMTVVFLEIGNEVYIAGDIYEGINQGVRKGYQEGYLRKSIVENPLKRENTKDNTPAVIHTKIVSGDKVTIKVVPKGGGSENMSLVKMLKPADGIKGVKALVLKTVIEAGANPCPPIIVGIGLGGTMEKAALMAKEALLRPIDDQNPKEEIAQLEKELLDEINQTGIGPQGLGGSITALACKIEVYPCHIASLPVAINFNCHAARHKEIII